MISFFQRAAVSSAGAVVGQPAILGLRLRPLCVGHSLLLLSFGSPFLLPEQRTGVRDFFLAIFTCAHAWRESERLLRTPWLPLYFRLWAWTQRRKSLNTELARFRVWWDDQVETPPFRSPQGKPSRPCGAPRPWVRLMFLMSEMGYTEAAALDTPILRANALYATWLDWNNRAELLTESPAVDGAFWKFAAERDKALFNDDGTKKATQAKEAQASSPESQQAGQGPLHAPRSTLN